MNVWLILASFFVALSAEKIRYDGYQVFRLFPSSLEQHEAIRKLIHQYDFWKQPKTLKDVADVMVSPEKRGKFLTYLYKNGIQYQIKNENVQDLIDHEELMQTDRSNNVDWTQYNNLKEIHEWLDQIAANYSSIAKTVVVGTSYEDRQVKGIEITFGDNLTGVFIEAGIHAREWVSPASATWMINEILRSSSDSIIRKFNYFIFPVTNPDGYDYSWNTDRLWRKTRTPYSTEYSRYICYGADPNRNWDVHWGDLSGCFPSPCDETYCGPKVFSEKSILHLAEYIKLIQKPKNLDIYFSFHSYSQLYLYPYGFSSDKAPNKKLWDKMGKAAAEALYAVHQQTLVYGQISQELYDTTGDSIDWAYTAFNLTVAGTFEMRDQGLYGFVLPPDQIIPNSEEYYAAVQAIFKVYLEHKGSLINE